MIISWLLRTNQIRWFYFSIFRTCSYGTKVETIEKNQSFTTTDEGFLEKLRISIVILLKILNRMDSVLYIREEGNQKRKKMSSSFFYHLGAVRDESLMHGFE